MTEEGRRRWKSERGRLVETATEGNAEQKDEKTRCAICLACFVEKTKTTTKKDEEEEEEEDALCYAVEMPCKHLSRGVHTVDLNAGRRCPTCRKGLREKKIQKAKNGSEEEFSLDQWRNDDASTRHIQRDEELDREESLNAAKPRTAGDRRIGARTTSQRGRRGEESDAEEEDEDGLEHEGMNEEIFERVMEHAMELLEEAA